MKQVDKNVWVIPSEVRIAPGVFLPLQSTVIRLTDGTLWLHSPVNLSPTDISDLKRLGEVAHLIAPNLLHHLYFADAAAAFPAARTYGAARLAKKRPDLRFDETLCSETQVPGMDAFFIAGAPALQETMFVHRQSRTLVSADIFQNNFNTKNWLSTMTCVAAGSYKQLGVCRLAQFMVKDRSAFKHDLHRVLDSSFERLIPCHGEVIEAQANTRCRAACNRVKWLSVDG